MTKEQLKRYHDIKREADHLRGNLEILEGEMYAPISRPITGMPGGAAANGDGSTLEKQVLRHAELTALYREKLDALCAEQLTIERAIDRLSSQERDLMRHRYIDGLSWEEVCVAMHYSWRRVHQIHAVALIKLREEGAE